MMVPTGLPVFHPDLPEDASNFLLDLANGKYGRAVAAVKTILAIIGRVWPPALAISKGMSLFLFVHRITAPRHVQPDGRGGVVPTTNSRVHPTDGRFIRWSDGRWVYDDFIGGMVKERFPPPT